MNIRKTTGTDRRTILSIHEKAFGGDKGPEIAELVDGLLSDQSAMPLLSLMAFDNRKAVGHILFTKAGLNPADASVSVQLLAPLAVLPEAHSKGVGGQLIENGLMRLKKAGVELGVCIRASLITIQGMDSNRRVRLVMKRPILFRKNMRVPGWFRNFARVSSDGLLEKFSLAMCSISHNIGGND